MKAFTFTLLFLSSLCLFSQTKDEREFRVEKENFPTNAQSVLKELPNSAKRLKLYKETDGEKVSYEAKFKFKKNRYSLEFDTNGVIEDIEMIVNKKSIPIEIIEIHFKSNYIRFKIIKIQTQYINTDSKNDKDFMIGVLNGYKGQKVNFEIIAEVKTESNRNVMEFLFTENGKFLNSRILKPTSYEHIMY